MNLYKQALQSLLVKISEEKIGDNVLTSQLVEIVKQDKELFELFLFNTKRANIKDLLVDYRQMYPNNGDYSFEQDLAINYLQEYKNKYANSYTKGVLSVIPEYIFLEDKKWINEMFHTNSAVFEYIDEKILLKLAKHDWFVNTLLESHSLGIKNFTKYIDVSNHLHMWKFIAKDMNLFAELPFPQKMNTFVIDNILDNLKIHSNSTNKLDWNIHINLIQGLANNIQDYEELLKCGKIQITTNDAHLITKENYYDRVFALGGYFNSMSESEKVLVLENRIELLKDNSKKQLIENPVLTYLTRGVDDEHKVGATYSYALIHYYNDLASSLNKKLLSIRSGEQYLIEKIAEFHAIDNYDIAQFFAKYKKQTLSQTGVNFNPGLFALVNILDTLLFESAMRKDIDTQIVKNKVLKF